MADRRLPARFFPWVFAFLMGGAMTAVITTILSLANDTQLARFPAAWFGNWLLAWLIATPAIVLVAPHARALAGRVAVPPALTGGASTAHATSSQSQSQSPSPSQSTKP